MRSALSVLLLVLVGSGCSGVVDAPLIAGRWVQEFMGPGSSFEMILTTNGSKISGTGEWFGEACCTGTVSVTGTINGVAVHLDITETSTFHGGGGLSHFDGTLVSPWLLHGTITREGSPTPTAIDYQRPQS